MPLVPAGLPRTLPVTPEDATLEPENGGGDVPPRQPRSPGDLKNEYISTLIGLLRTRGAQAGEVDTGLMERIEKLLDESSQ